ncbi:MAG TPA: hypothetical protein VHS97_18985, partial [Isosphaeraceae bacterium]|nr:hypothetical protein [Isosphaeraceae bacterium]
SLADIGTFGHASRAGPLRRRIARNDADDTGLIAISPSGPTDWCAPVFAQEVVLGVGLNLSSRYLCTPRTGMVQL